jgi:hypothetical protein
MSHSRIEVAIEDSPENGTGISLNLLQGKACKER